MITALLMVRDRFVGMTELESPLNYIRYSCAMMLEPLIITDSATFSPSSAILNQEIIFRLHARVDYDKYEYQYEHVQTNQKFSVIIHEAFESLPDENVNLDKLKNKFRKGDDMKKLLLQYFRSI